MCKKCKTALMEENDTTNLSKFNASITPKNTIKSYLFKIL